MIRDNRAVEAPSIPPRAVVGVGAALCAGFGLYAWAVFALSFHHDGLIAPRYNAPGADFMVYYLASQTVLDGNLGVLFDGARFTASLNAEFQHWLTAPLPLHPWIYPPHYLLLVAPLALVPFEASYAVFMAGTFGLAAAALLAGRVRQRAFLALAFALAPAAANNALVGQNAFLMAALLVGGFRLVDKRPALGGALLGVLTVKPQLFLMVPVALAAARAWRALALTALAALALAALSALAFGIEPWLVWVQNVLEPGSAFLRAWSELSLRWGDSVESAALALGASRALAAAAQGAAVLAAAACVFTAFRRGDALALPVLLAATIAAAPHVGGYDAILLALAAALSLSHALETGARPFDLALLLVLWLAPLYGSPAQGLLGIALPLAAIVFAAAAARPGQPP